MVRFHKRGKDADRDEGDGAGTILAPRPAGVAGLDFSLTDHGDSNPRGIAYADGFFYVPGGIRGSVAKVYACDGAGNRVPAATLSGLTLGPPRTQGSRDRPEPGGMEQRVDD